MLFSSHILEEVEQVARQIEVVVSGRHAASGDFGADPPADDRPPGAVRRDGRRRPPPRGIASSPSRRSSPSRCAPAGGVDVSVTDFGAFARAAAAGGARARHPDHRAHPHRRVARERLRLPGGGLSDEPHPAAPVDPGPLRPPPRARARCSSPARCSCSPCWCGCSPTASVGLEAVAGLGFTLALPLVALLAATAVLGPEIDDGSIVYLLAKPVNRHVIAVSKFAAAWGATMLLGALPVAPRGPGARPVAARAGRGPGRRCRGLRHGRTPRCSSPSRRSPGTPWSSGCSSCSLWEGVLGSVFAGIRWLSVGAWGRAVAGQLSDHGPGCRDDRSRLRPRGRGARHRRLALVHRRPVALVHPARRRVAGLNRGGAPCV